LQTAAPGIVPAEVEMVEPEMAEPEAAERRPPIPS
jgi:hypothetical protein